MRKLFILSLASIILMISCISSESYLKKGQYNAAVYQAVKKIRKKQKDKDVEVLKKAYPIANQQDIDRINFLRQEGRPDIWDEVFERYQSLKNRQNLVKTVIPITYTGGTLNFKTIDYDAEIIAAKKKAAEYFYVHAQSLLKTGNRFDARLAYDELMQIANYYPNYQNTAQLLQVAREKGMTNVLLSTKNHTHFRLMNDFVQSLYPKDLTPLNSHWVHYTIDKNLTNHYDVILNLRGIVLSPELLKEKQYTETKEIRDGWEYQLDQNGNVMKDSLGNDIKKPKFITISCVVTETIQRRDVNLKAELNYYERGTHDNVKNSPINANFFIENVFAVANGDFRALKSETKKLLERKPILMPTDLDMIYEAGNVIREAVKTELMKNRGVIK